MTLVAVGVGGSGPLARRFVEAAIDAIDRHPRLAFVSDSARYENPAVSMTAAHRFVNAAVLVETALAPTALLDELLALERRLGRVRTLRWGPRSLDLDLLWMEGVRLASPRLVVPHPRLEERAFALVPLAEAFDRAGLPLPLELERARRRQGVAARLRRLPPWIAPRRRPSTDERQDARAGDALS